MNNITFVNKLLSKFNCQKGAIDRVLVTLLMVIIAVVGLVGLESWSSSQKDGLINQSNTVISNVVNE